MIKANIDTMGEIDPGSLEMRVSGFGVVPANYDAKTKLVSYEATQKLAPKTYTVILSAKVKGKPVETKRPFPLNSAVPLSPNYPPPQLTQPLTTHNTSL